MDKQNFDKKINRLQGKYSSQNRLLLYMVFSNILLVIIAFAMMNKERVVLVPEVAPEHKLWIKQDIASNEYLTTLSRNIIDLILNITPNNVDAQHNEIIKLVSSKYIDDLKTNLAKINKVIKENNISQNFYINSIRVLDGKSTVYIEGDLNTYIEKTLSSTQDQIYKLSFKTNNFYTQLTSFELLKPDAPELKDLNQ